MQNKLTSFSDLLSLSIDQLKDSKRLIFYFVSSLVNGLVNFALLLPLGLIIGIAVFLFAGSPNKVNSFEQQVRGVTSYLSAENLDAATNEESAPEYMNPLSPKMVAQPATNGATTQKFMTFLLFVLIVCLPYLLFVVGFNSAFKIFSLLHINYNELPSYGLLVKKSFSKALRVAVVSLIAAGICLVGFLFLIIPGLVLAMLFGYAPWIAVHDNKGITASLKTSMDMVKPYFFDILGRNLLVFAMYFVVILIVNAIVGVLQQNNIPLIGELISTAVNFLGAYLVVLFSTNVYMDVRNALGMEKPSLDSDKPSGNIGSAGIGAVSSGYGMGTNTSTATMGSTRSTLAATSYIDTTSSDETWKEELPPNNLNTIN